MADWERVTDPFDPLRCQSGHSNQQCWYKAHNGTKYCPRHGGVAASPNAAIKKQRWNYRLGKWQAKVQEFASSPVLKSLREEIGILKTLLEETVVKCNDSHELLFASQSIVLLVNNIKEVIQASQKLEAQLGQQLSQSELFAIAEELVKVIIETVPDPQVCEQLANKIGITLTRSLTSKDQLDGLSGQIPTADTKQIDSPSGNTPLYLGREISDDAGSGWAAGALESTAVSVVKAAT